MPLYGTLGCVWRLSKGRRRLPPLPLPLPARTGEPPPAAAELPLASCQRKPACERVPRGRMQKRTLLATTPLSPRLAHPPALQLFCCLPLVSPHRHSSAPPCAAAHPRQEIAGDSPIRCDQVGDAASGLVWLSGVVTVPDRVGGASTAHACPSSTAIAGLAVSGCLGAAPNCWPAPCSCQDGCWSGQGCPHAKLLAQRLRLTPRVAFLVPL